MTLTDSELSNLARYRSAQLHQVRYGVSLSQAGHDVEHVMTLVCKARLSLANAFREEAHENVNSAAPRYRLATNRAYYGAYHAGRTLLYFCTGGDDHERHEDVPKHLPDDLVNRDIWRSELLIAKTARHEADYNPFSGADDLFKTRALEAISLADRFYLAVFAYLTFKGLDLG